MGLYAKARKLIEAREKESFVTRPIINFSSSEDRENVPVRFESLVEPLVKQIESEIDLESRFFVIGISLAKIIEGISLSSPKAGKNRVSAELLAYIAQSSSNIAHAYQFAEDRVVLVVQSPDSIDLELLVHQIYNGLRISFAGCPDDDCTIFESKARIFPQDGNDVRMLIRAVIA
jgi:hypothetical protein